MKLLSNVISPEWRGSHVQNVRVLGLSLCRVRPALCVSFALRLVARMAASIPDITLRYSSYQRKKYELSLSPS